MKYQYPKCKTTIESIKKLEYCVVCGGKYKSGCTFNDLMAMAEMFKGFSMPKNNKD